jgi:prepilin-type N-terminal cleavage/methylation domain-containing protein
MTKGFTLIEIMITVFILSIAIVGVYSSFSVMLVLTSSSTDRLIATYLAQEGMEIVANIRANNWLTCLTPGCYSTNLLGSNDYYWEVDYTTSPASDTLTWLKPWPSRGNCQNDTSPGDCLNVDVNGFYSYLTIGTYKQTKFKRKLTIMSLLEGSAMKVVSEVFWREKPTILNASSTQASIKVEEVLYDWY